MQPGLILNPKGVRPVMRVYPLLATIALIAVSSSLYMSSAHAADADNALDVMSYNIRYGTAKDGPDRWEVRKPRAFQIIKKYKPHVIGLQEAQSAQIEDLLEAFPGYENVGVGRDDGKAGGEFSSIMFDTSRLRVLRTDTFWLSDTPEVPGSTHWGNRNFRLCTWAYFKDLKTGNYFYLFNTHLDHVSQESREKSVNLILQRIKQRNPKDPVIFTGDFNANEENPVVKAVREAGFRDSFRVLHPDAKEVGTTNAFKEGRQSAKIDYMFVDDNWEIHAAEIIDDKVDGRWPSDHLPVTARVTMK